MTSPFNANFAIFKVGIFVVEQVLFSGILRLKLVAIRGYSFITLIPSHVVVAAHMRSRQCSSNRGRRGSTTVTGSN